MDFVTTLPISVKKNINYNLFYHRQSAYLIEGITNRIQAKLSIFTNWKDISYNLIFIVIDKLIKMIYSKLAQINQCT